MVSLPDRLASPPLEKKKRRWSCGRMEIGGGRREIGGSLISPNTFKPYYATIRGLNLPSLRPIRNLSMTTYLGCLKPPDVQILLVSAWSDVIQRKFTITKALLFKADRSSFDRFRQQIYKLELEQKRLEEDAFVYNWLQQQLKLSPAYKKVILNKPNSKHFIRCCLAGNAKMVDKRLNIDLTSMTLSVGL
ncbi:hypothetical protein CsSME_00052115 [Camellia sinensis var. sinensis]